MCPKGKERLSDGAESRRVAGIKLIGSKVQADEKEVPSAEEAAEKVRKADPSRAEAAGDDQNSLFCRHD